MTVDTIDIDEDVERLLQEAHEDETFVYRAPKRVWVDACATCNDRPLWGCKAFGCKPSESCFILCPSCGKHGFAAAIPGWVPDWELAAILLEKMGR